MKPGCAFIIVWFAVIAGCGPGESARGLPQAEFDLSAYSRTVSNGITTIHIPAGVYRVSRSIELPSNTTLEGEGDSTILTAGTATFSGTRLITNDEPSRGNINIIIRAMQIRVANLPSAGYSGGLLSFSNVDGLVISGVSIVLDAPMYAVDIAARVRNTVVEGCSITNSSTTGGGGVMIRNGDPLPAPATANITIRNNRVASVSDEPIAAFGWEGMVEDVQIEGNTVQAAGAAFGISVYGHNSPGQNGMIRRAVVSGNVVIGGKHGGVGVMGGAEDVSVTGNQVEGTDADGIFIHPGGDGLPPVRTVRVTDNTIQNVGRHGIFAIGEAAAVERNSITDCPEFGIYAGAGVDVIGNVFRRCAGYILLEAPSDAIIRDNIYYP